MAEARRLLDAQWDSDGRTLVWLESRSGRTVLVCASRDDAHAPRDLTSDIAIRAQVGYGGGDFTVSHGTLFFVAKSGRIYRQSLSSGSARPITPEFGHAASPTVSHDGRWLLYVHTYEGTDVLAVVDTEGKQWPQRIAVGHDFYMQPRWHPSRLDIAYIAWDHPHMPWDSSTLYYATCDVSDGGLVVTDTRTIAGGADSAIFQPEFSPDGRWLSYVSDTSGWGHVYLHDLEQATDTQAASSDRCITRGNAEYGRPAWIQGMRTYGWTHDSHALICVCNERGFARFYRQPITGDDSEELRGLKDYTWFDQPAISPTQDDIAIIASSSTQPARLVVCCQSHATEDESNVRIISRSSTEQIRPTDLAQAQPICWKVHPDVDVHGLLYLPPGYEPLSSEQEGTRPPAIIHIHGGPTAQATANYQPAMQFFATRGYVVLQINYRGSTGYGRAYMHALHGNWGISDVEDAISGACYLRDNKIADESRMVIMGGSAGGYTVLETLCKTAGFFKAGICLYGVSNLLSLVSDTHKFEERYLDSLVGPWPETSTRYYERSPIFHAETLHVPMAMFQGDEDTVVPRAQSDSIVESLRTRGVPHEYTVYEGEGHGWRRPETIEAYYKAVEAFLRHHVLFVR